MKRYLSLSIFIHCLFFSLFFLKQELIRQEQQQEQGSAGEKESGADFSVEVIEIADDADESSKQEKKDFYWGIGIGSDFAFIDIYGVTTYCYSVDKLYAGYSAETDGVLVGDYIYLINDKPIGGTNDLKGDGPKKMKLTIIRNGSKVIVYTERCKVWY